MQFNAVLSGQVKQYFACESQHQHGGFDMTDGIQCFFFKFRSDGQDMWRVKIDNLLRPFKIF